MTDLETKSASSRKVPENVRVVENAEDFARAVEWMRGTSGPAAVVWAREGVDEPLVTANAAYRKEVAQAFLAALWRAPAHAGQEALVHASPPAPPAAPRPA